VAFGLCRSPLVSVPKSVADVIRNHVVLEVECIDRMYLNVYQPRLQYDRGAAAFFRCHRRKPFASSQLMAPMTRDFVRRIERFAAEHGIEIVPFEKGQRKDDVALARYAKFEKEQGVVFIGKAQEKATVYRTVKRRDPTTGRTYPWLIRSTAMVNHYYFYCIDKDFGPFFLKFCSYFPYTARLCINGHEYLKRQLAQKHIAFEALDNGILGCEDPRRVQAICDGLSATKIDRLLRKWLRRLPHPFAANDRKAGYLYDVSILQAEFALTQVLDRPVSGRIFFEQVIRENLDAGRPDQVQLIFNRRVRRNTPGRFRTRVITEGVTPSLHVDYKHSRIKQYHKEGRALRTETTINNTRDFAIGRRLCNLPALRAVGFQANRRLLDVQRISHDPALGETAFQELVQPAEVDGQRASAMRFGDPTVLALFFALLMFRLLPRGFSNRDLRETVAPLLGKRPTDMTSGQMTYQLRRLRLRGLIRRIPKTHRYQVTEQGIRAALFFTTSASLVLRPLAAMASDPSTLETPPIRRILDQFHKFAAAIPELHNAA
jgi:hypothetical protein